MLWYKSWLETRWRFLIGLVVLMCSAGATVFAYPRVLELMPMVPKSGSGELFQRIHEGAELAREYRGFVWSTWFRQNAIRWSTLFAILLGTAGVLTASRGALFTLSLPVPRRRLLAVSAAVGLGELFVLSFAPALALPLLSPAISQSYGLVNALIHGACLFVALSVFFSLAFALSSFFSDPWRPLVIALAIAFALGLMDRVSGGAFSLYRVMSGESWFRSAEVPWMGLLVSAGLSAALYFTAVATIARRDF